MSRVEAAKLPASRPRFCRPEFAVPDFAFVYDRSYFDYQRDRVSIRTNKALKRRISRRRSRKRKRTPTVNRSVALTSQQCPYCGGTDITRRPHGRLARLAYDLQFTPSGVRRHVTRFMTAWHCYTMRKGICGQPGTRARRTRPARRSQSSRNRFLLQRLHPRRLLEDAMRVDVLLMQLVEDHGLENRQAVSH